MTTYAVWCNGSSLGQGQVQKDASSNLTGSNFFSFRFDISSNYNVTNVMNVMNQFNNNLFRFDISSKHVESSICDRAMSFLHGTSTTTQLYLANQDLPSKQQNLTQPLCCWVKLSSSGGTTSLDRRSTTPHVNT